MVNSLLVGTGGLVFLIGLVEIAAFSDAAMGRSVDGVIAVGGLVLITVGA